MMMGIENILFWAGYWMDKFLPLVNLFIAIGFHSVVINGIINRIKNAVNEKTEKWYTG